jgi:hypothetical protein
MINCYDEMPEEQVRAYETSEPLVLTARPGEVVTFDQCKVPPSIKLEGVGTLEPNDDITPLEAVRLSILVACCSAPRYVAIDYEGYIDQHNLRRHFRSE